MSISISPIGNTFSSQSFSRLEKQKITSLHNLCSSEFSRETIESPYFLCLRLHVSFRPFSWRQNTWCGKHIPLSCPLPYLAPTFCIPSWPQDAPSSPIRQAKLKRCLNVAASLHYCHLDGDSLLSITIWRQTSVYATSMRCRSNLLIFHWYQLADCLHPANVPSKCNGGRGKLFACRHFLSM